MPGELVTPRDELTGLPLPILPFEHAEMTGWHHHAHPRNSKLLQGLGGYSVRTVRVQLVDGHPGTAIFNKDGSINCKYGEHQRYHLFYGGPELPESEKEKFEYSIWATAGYVPSEAINVRGLEPTIEQMKPEQIDRLHNGEIKVSDRTFLSKFLKEYVLDQGLSEIDNTTLDEFVYTQDQERKMYLGHWILSQASEVAAEPIEGTYKVVYKAGLISPSMSSRAADVVHLGLGTPKMKKKIVEELQDKLAA